MGRYEKGSILYRWECDEDYTNSCLNQRVDILKKHGEYDKLSRLIALRQKERDIFDSEDFDEVAWDKCTNEIAAIYRYAEEKYPDEITIY